MEQECVHTDRYDWPRKDRMGKSEIFWLGDELALGMVHIVSYNLRPFLSAKEHYESVSSGDV